ncbi:MAG: type II secretion system secretin GspD [Phycisphaerales bacterium]|nr:MAG: type II secretion system secretin GspD [Phycisphaerales bacterium]
MKTRYNNIPARLRRTHHLSVRNAVHRLVQIVAVTCALALSGFGCGVETKAVDSSDVCPIQLQTRPSSPSSFAAATAAVRPPVNAARPEMFQGQYTSLPLGVSANLVSYAEPLAQPPAPRLTQSAESPAPTPVAQERTPIPQEPSTPVESQPPVTATAQPPVVPAPHPGPPVVIPPEMADELVQINFEEVDIRTVLKTIGEITGINFILAKNVSGPVTVMSPTPIPLKELYGFLQQILDVHGYATIETDNAVKIVPKEEASKRSLQVRIGADPAFIPKNDAMVTQILPIKYAAATEISEIVQSLLPAGAQMTVYPRTKSIMVTDISANIHHIAQIIQQLDVEGSRENVVRFPLQYASAQVLSEQITRILSENQAPAPQAGRSRSVPSVENGPQVLPDERTNSLVVMAGEQDMETVRSLVAQLDVERPTGVDKVHVTYLKNADANDVAPALEAALASMKLTGVMEAAPQIQVTADDSTNSLIIVASPQDFEMISGIVEKLDIVREQVLVEMKFVEVTEESLTEIGVDWATLDEAVSDSIRGFGMTNLGPRVDFLNGTLEGLAAGFWKATDDGVSIGAILQALQRDSAVNILSTPHIVTSNHRTARIVVGENIPYVAQSRITEGFDSLNSTNIKTYEYKDVGITLEVTPHISQSGLIRLEVDSEFTKLLESIQTGSLDTPTTAKREAQTHVTMQSGATVVIGGLIRDDTSRIEDKVPLFGDLPLVGALFKMQKDVVQKTNLLIFITPHVMTDQQQQQELTRAKKEQMPAFLREDR